MGGSVHRADSQRDFNPTSAMAIRRMANPKRRVMLRSLTATESKPVNRKPGLTAVGVSRRLPEDVLAQGEWSSTAEGKRVWRLAIQSPGAETLRVRFANFDVGTGSVWLLGTDPTGAAVTVGPYSHKGPFDDGEFWSDLVSGESVIIAYEPSPDYPATEVPFNPFEVSHRFAAGRTNSVVKQSTADDRTSVPLASAASCALDVSCYPQYSEPASAVGLMIFESEGETYQCSGALVSSASQPPAPLFLTANHCIGNDTEARSLITIFNYQTSTCNGRPPSLSTLPRVTGATFLQGQPMALGDFTLLRLASFPNTDVRVLGWYAGEIALNEQVTGISHPVGDYKRIALGQRTRDVTIRFEDGAQMPANMGIQVSWSQGVTQGGSSGSPLLAEINGRPYVVGTLSAGPNVDEDNDRQVCRIRNLIASYGRFSAAFPYLESFLTAMTGTSGAGNSPERQAILTATPGLVMPAAGQTLGATRLSWQASGVTAVQIRVLSPTGPPMTGAEPASGSAMTGDWVSDGMLFYLQDASDGDSSGEAKTLASVRVNITANNR